MPVYLLHFEPPYRHARHYIGYTADSDVVGRVRCHVNGKRGRRSPLVAAAVRAGCEVSLARVWEDGDRELEKRLKSWKRAARHCPQCREARDAEMRDPVGGVVGGGVSVD